MPQPAMPQSAASQPAASQPAANLPTVMRSVHLLARPVGVPRPSDFAVVAAPLEPPPPGHVLVRNIAMSVDPYMRGKMDAAESYTPPFALNTPLLGGAVGEVIAVGPEIGAGAGGDGLDAGGTAPRLRVGAMVLHGLGWRDHAVVPTSQVQQIDTEKASATAYLGALGITGQTAFGGLMESASFTAGDAVFVSGAAGAVGSIVGQLARLGGASRVIGSAGSAEKVRHLVEDLGFDAAFNYKDGPVAAQLAQAAPDGIDVYFDNVGGEHLEAAIGAMNKRGRIAICGAISHYNDVEPSPGPRNIFVMAGRGLRMQGFLVTDFPHLRARFDEEVGGHLAAGRLTCRETFVDGGVDAAVDAFLRMLSGQNTGKMIVRF